jgi:hypothetical protein
MEALLITVAALACPVGMGVMMWFMAKGGRRHHGRGSSEPENLEQLRAEHRRIGAELARLEDGSTPSVAKRSR